MENYQQRKNPPPSLFFNPLTTFSQAFSFVKSSEFYSPPPQAPPPSTPVPSASCVGGNSAIGSASQSTSGGLSRNAVLVSLRQKGNPLLKHIRNVKWEFADIIYYLYYQIRELLKNFRLRVVLCHVDVEDVVKPLLEVKKTALLHDCTLLCGWSLEECGRYLETIKVYENKPADIIQGQMDTDYLSRLNHTLTSVRPVKQDGRGYQWFYIRVPIPYYGCIHSMEDLARCPGIGLRKVRRLYDTFHEPFRRVVPNIPFAPEAAMQKVAEPNSSNQVDEVATEAEEAGSERTRSQT